MTRSTRLAHIGAAALLFATTGAFAQEPPSSSDARHAEQHHLATASKQQDAATKTEGEAVAAEPQTGMDLEAIEAELDLLVTRMNDSQGASKVDAMANLLAALVRQQRAMCSAMRAEGAGEGGCCQQRPPARNPAPEDPGPGHE